MRMPAVAGRFYPATRETLTEAIEECFGGPSGPGMPGEAGSARRIAGAMVPHAGIMISGPNAAHAFRRIREDGRPEAYVIIGPDHHGVCRGSVLCSEPYVTPLGECGTHEGICGRLSRSIEDAPELHAWEHSVEVVVPFLQYIDPDPRIVPIIMGDQSPAAAEGLASALREACEGTDVVVIASTDMSHYIPRERAATLDGMVLDRIRAMDWERMYRVVRENGVSMCGYGPTAVMMMLCEGCTPEGVLHTDSYDALGLDPSSVVGYGSAVMVRGG